jgi:hypothetical protein
VLLQINGYAAGMPCDYQGVRRTTRTASRPSSFLAGVASGRVLDASCLSAAALSVGPLSPSLDEGGCCAADAEYARKLQDQVHLCFMLR